MRANVHETTSYISALCRETSQTYTLYMGLLATLPDRRAYMRQ